MGQSSCAYVRSYKLLDFLNIATRIQSAESFGIRVAGDPESSHHMICGSCQSMSEASGGFHNVFKPRALYLKALEEPQVKVDETCEQSERKFWIQSGTKFEDSF